MGQIAARAARGDASRALPAARDAHARATSVTRARDREQAAARDRRCRGANGSDAACRGNAAATRHGAPRPSGTAARSSLLVPSGGGPLRHSLGGPRGDQLRRVRVRQGQEREQRRRAGADAVRARNVARIRARRRRAQPARRDLRRREPARRKRRRTAGTRRAAALQQLGALRGRGRALRPSHGARPQRILRVLQLAGLRANHERLRACHRPALSKSVAEALEPGVVSVLGVQPA